MMADIEQSATWVRIVRVRLRYTLAAPWPAEAGTAKEARSFVGTAFAWLESGPPSRSAHCVRGFGALTRSHLAIAALDHPRRRRMAERVGFEPTVRFPVHTLSKRAPSTTRTSLRLSGINSLP